MNLLDLDARWRRFHDEDRACPCCGRHFNGVFDLGFDHPDAWPFGPLPEGEAEVQFGEDKLGTDLCRLGEVRFIRCILPLPIQGSDEVFNFGTWAAVAPGDFYAYIDACFGEGRFDGCAALLMNALPGFDTEGDTPCTLLPGPEGERPRLMAQEGPLMAAQEDGISFDHLLDIYAASGSDIRPHLAA
ncbi:DUF2199 domain-containing protein [Marinibacterium profundimaris]|uniref:DUF2199 domain-containing protein n=1 Tax=Marinibacterium profundimaris TaxID=1679460 RepID=UPI001E65A055|nr:DUF2199 domain-containing protein [Marinibacterium profundimaris]